DIDPPSDIDPPLPETDDPFLLVDFDELALLDLADLLDAFDLLETDLLDLADDFAEVDVAFDLEETPPFLLELAPPPASSLSVASSGAPSGFAKNLDMHSALPNAFPP